MRWFRRRRQERSMLEKKTTRIVVDSIEAQLPSWQKLGYEVVTRAPEKGTLGFVIMNGKAGELMLQTRESLKGDLPDVLARTPQFLFYADVKSLDQAKQA